MAVTSRACAQNVVPIDISSSAQTAFADKTADDRQGGWTDQGAENDLSVLKPGPLNAGALTFNILDDAATGGKSCFVFSGPDRAYLPPSARIAVSGAPVWNTLYLLHAAGWMPAPGSAVGVMKIIYSDGSRDRIEIIAGRDVRDWWNPGPLPNAAVAWAGRNGSNEVGLYASKFAIQQKPIREIQLESTGKGVWMVAAISASSSDVPLPFPPPLVVTENSEWRPLNYSLDIEPGSIFDFSAMNDAPAGKYGPVRVTPDGHFEFTDRPGQRIRFSGTNVCMGALFLTEPQADELALRLSRSGYNVVRLHLYDRFIQQKGGSSGEFDSEQLSKLDYLIAAFKKRGLYINIDIHSYRQFSPNEVPDLGRDITFSTFKPLLHISEAAFSAWQRFTENLLRHVNPHTQLAWGMEPAIIGICPVNEDPIFALYRWTDSDIYQRFKARLAQENPTANPAETSMIHESLNRIHMSTDDRMRSVIKPLAPAIPLTGMNMWERQIQVFARERYDYVDNHLYLDHPKFPVKKWNLPYQFSQADDVKVHARMPRDIMPSRIFNKPFTVTEFNQAWPNRQRAQLGIMMPAYAGLQDWDALFSFGYSGTAGSVLQVERGTFFQITSDPIALLADRVSSVIFRRGDSRPAPQAVAFLVDERTAFSGRDLPAPFSESFSMLGLITRIGSGVAKTYSPAALKRAGVAAVVRSPSSGAVPEGIPQYADSPELLQNLIADGLLPRGAHDPATDSYSSATGQIRLQPRAGAMTFVSESSECFVLPANQSLEGSLVSVKNGSTFSSVYILSTDGKPLRQSQRILVLHLTDALNSRMKFQDDSCTVVADAGRLPHLLKRGSARISIRDPDGRFSSLTLWPVDLNGRRGAPLSLDRRDGVIEFEAQTVSAQGNYLAYEIGLSQ